jgi:hypothetical protein
MRVSLDYEMLIESEPSSPEKRLMVAVIHRAILDYYGHDSHPYHQHEAARWLFQDSRGPMSLYWVCNWLSEDPKWLQISIQRMVRKRKGFKGPIMRVDK